MRAHRLLLCALLALGCAGTAVPSLPSGYVPDESTGIAILRIERVNGSGEPDTFGGANDDWVAGGPRARLHWIREEDRSAYDFIAASDGTAADFYLALPPGHYVYYFSIDERLWSRDYELRFEVRPGVVVCAGGIHFHHDYSPMNKGTPRFVTLHDDCDAVTERFRASHPEVASEVQTELFQKNRGRRPFWDPEAWGENRSP